MQELDVLRGLAAMAVVLFHYTVRYDPRDPHNYALPEIGDPGYSWKDAFLGNVPFFVIALYFLWLAWRIGRGPGQDASRLD